MSEKLLQSAAVRAEKLSGELSDDLASLKTASLRVIDAQTRAEGERLIANVKRFADQLATELRRNENS